LKSAEQPLRTDPVRERTTSKTKVRIVLLLEDLAETMARQPVSKWCREKEPEKCFCLRAIRTHSRARICKFLNAALVGQR
jgi:hypothetical protein